MTQVDYSETYYSLRQMYRNLERLMKMRVQAGNALCAYFYRSVLEVKSGDTIYPLTGIDIIDNPDDPQSKEEDTQYAKILARLVKDWRDIWKVTKQVTGTIQTDEHNNLIIDSRKTNGSEKNTPTEVKALKKMRRVPKNDVIARLNTHTESQERLDITKDNFENYRNGGMIQKYNDYLLVDNYMNLVALEDKQLKDMEEIMKDLPMYHHLKQTKGIGSKMIAFILSEIDIFKIVYASEIISYAGLDSDDKGRGKSTKHNCDGCFRLFLEFKTGKIKTNTRMGEFQSFYRHRNAYFTDQVVALSGGVDDNKKKRIYLGRIDAIDGLPNDVTASNDKRLEKDALTKLISFRDDERFQYSELIKKNGIDVDIIDNAITPSKFKQIIINGTDTNIYINMEDNVEYTISCQRSLTYNKDVQAKFIGTLAVCLIRSGTTTINGVKTKELYPAIYEEKKAGILKRPITMEELGKYSAFKNGKKDKVTKLTLDELKKMVGEGGSYYNLPAELRGKIESDNCIGKERNAKANANALRRMLCQFIIREIYRPWRRLEGLPVHNDYAEGVLGIVHKDPR